MSAQTPDDRRRAARATKAGNADAGAAPAGDAAPPPPPGDTLIPMLTDVLTIPRAAGTELPESLDDASWAELSLHMRQNVVERLMRGAGTMLDTPLRETLDAVLDRHLRSLQSDLHESLSLLVRDLVSRAVADELARVHAEIQRRQRGGSPKGGRGGKT